MTLGWVRIVFDGKPAEVRTCYVYAWHDPEWRKANGLPPRLPPRKGRKPVLLAEPTE